MKTIPCLRLSHLTESQQRAYVIADNQIALNSGWDADLLALELADLSGLDFDLDLLGFDAADLPGLMGEEPSEASEADAEPQIDRAEELRKVWGTEQGQLWRLGEHRLLCGDSTSEEDVARLMGGAKAELCVTDPPYLLDTAQGNKGCFSESYKKVTGKALQEISDSVDFAKMFSSIEAGCRVFNAFVFCSNKQIPELMTCGFSRGLSTTLCAWNKYNSVPFSHGTWRQDAEWCVHFRTGDATFQGDSELKRKIETLPLNPSRYGHPTEKPLALIGKYIRVGSEVGQVVLDLFCGSGTTLIAAEQLNRICYGMEISPAYVAVILQRFQDATGKTPTLVSDV